MEDNHILLMRVLKIHYKDRLQILDESLKVIKEYSNKPKSSQNEYDITSLTLQSMLNDLPTEILKYFLTMVPLPKNRDTLAKNKDNLVKTKEDPLTIRGILLKYLNEEIPPLVALAKPEPVAKVVELPPVVVINDDDEKEEEVESVKQPEPVKKIVNALKRPQARCKRKKTARGPPPVTGCKKLLDICAEYFVQNEASLNQAYRNLNERLWRMVHTNQYEGDELQKLYDMIRDVNKKTKWLRLLSADDITDEIVREEYGYCELFITGKQPEGGGVKYTPKGDLLDAIARFCY